MIVRYLGINVSSIVAAFLPLEEGLRLNLPLTRALLYSRLPSDCSVITQNPHTTPLTNAQVDAVFAIVLYSGVPTYIRQNLEFITAYPGALARTILVHVTDLTASDLAAIRRKLPASYKGVNVIRLLEEMIFTSPHPRSDQLNELLAMACAYNLHSLVHRIVTQPNCVIEDFTVLRPPAILSYLKFHPHNVSVIQHLICLTNQNADLIDVLVHYELLYDPWWSKHMLIYSLRFGSCTLLIKLYQQYNYPRTAFPESLEALFTVLTIVSSDSTVFPDISDWSSLIHQAEQTDRVHVQSLIVFAWRQLYQYQQAYKQ